MKYTVYHAKEEKIRESLRYGWGGPKLYFPHDYDVVAIVEVNRLEDVFHVTNHIDSDWTDNPEVCVTIGDKFRSTSVGDIVSTRKYNDKGKGRRYWICAPFGWHELREGYMSPIRNVIKKNKEDAK